MLKLLPLQYNEFDLLFSSLEAAGILRELANYLDAHIPSSEVIAGAIGVVSAIIDNVPLVAATMGMYDLSSFPQDSEFWQLIAYCAGTGGSMLIIGSAAGVAFMGMEKVDFLWYLRKVWTAAQWHFVNWNFIFLYSKRSHSLLCRWVVLLLQVMLLVLLPISQYITFPFPYPQL